MNTNELELTKIVLALFGTLAGFLTLWKGLYEYQRQNTTKRAEFFLQMAHRLAESPACRKLAESIDKGTPDLNSIVSIQDKMDYIAFFEEVALMVRSRIIQPEVAHYMFAPAAYRCERHEQFWEDLDRDSPTWALFREFVKDMERMEETERVGNTYRYVGKLRL